MATPTLINLPPPPSDPTDIKVIFPTTPMGTPTTHRQDQTRPRIRLMPSEPIESLA
ncbi:MAG: hypothetical protein Q9198_007158 [Flavoplaca austrocitrina]